LDAKSERDSVVVFFVLWRRTPSRRRHRAGMGRSGLRPYMTAITLTSRQVHT
jgi:hypothetical protein